MFYGKKYILYMAIIVLAFKCSNPNNLSNLFPDSTDKRTLNNSGLQTGDRVSDFPLYNTNGAVQYLSAILATKSAVVIYFTMWCPVCDIHMGNIRNHIKPAFPSVEFYMLDYVSGSLAAAHDNQIASSYLDFNCAWDKDFYLTNIFTGTMGTTVVIDKGFVLKMNEDLKNGQRLSDVLHALP